jgi:hypothetical protein
VPDRKRSSWISFRSGELRTACIYHHVGGNADGFCRQIHSRHLAFLREGLLLSDQATALIIRDILNVCRRFTGLVERWGGDLLPESLDNDEISQREHDVNDVAEVSPSSFGRVVADTDIQNLNELFTDFFGVLVESQNPTAGDNSGSTSVSRTSRATQMMQIHSSRVMSRQVGSASRINKTSSFGREDGLDEARSGKHIEQRKSRLRAVIKRKEADWRTKRTLIHSAPSLAPERRRRRSDQKCSGRRRIMISSAF